VGGTSVISDGVLTELAQYGTAVRIAGTNRYSTAVEGAKYFNLSVDHYYIATGLNFPDAITGAVLAAKSGTGVLLVDGTLDIPNLVVRDFIVLKSIKSVTLFGGTSVISEGIQNWFIDNL
jgi:putative cell wall-binding protein